MPDVFATDRQRELAAMVRDLLVRVDYGRGDDRELSADILSAIDAPALIGDVVGCLDCAFALTSWLRQPTGATLTRAAEQTCRAGRAVTAPELARRMTGIALRVFLATLERKPA